MCKTSVSSYRDSKNIRKKLAHIKKPISLSIIGCVVNGPGEAAQTEIGITGGGQDSNLLYLSGIPHTKVPSSEIVDKVVKLVEENKRLKFNHDTNNKSKRYYIQA